MKNATAVLLIEPHPTAARIIGEMLERCENIGYELVRVRSLQEAEAIFKICHFDVVMSDLSLPDSAAAGTLERLKALAPELPIVAISGPAERDFAGQALRHGACHVLYRNQLNQPLILGAIDYALEQKALRSATAWKKENSGFHDRLTGLPNRQLFEDRLTQAIRLAKRQKQELAVLALRLETEGPGVGETMIQEAALRLTRCLRESDTVGRLDGGEFGLILPNSGGPQELAALCAKIQQELRQPVLVENGVARAEASLGVACYPADAEEADALAVRALSALERAGVSGGACVKFYNERLDVLVTEREQFETDLRIGIGQGQFKLVFQPLLNLADSKPQMLEALVRWRHPKKGWIAPMDFIPQAEASGLIEPLGSWIFEQACQELKRLDRAGFAGHGLSVNLTARQFHNRGLLPALRRIAAEQRVNPARICLEVSESGAMQDMMDSCEILKGIREIGMRVAMDDFGTGSSSLSMLSRLSVDILKLDKSFIKDLARRPEDQSIVSLVIAMAHRLNMKVVAEGVEEEEQHAMLQAMGCDMAQGFLLGRPRPMEDLIQAWQLGFKADPEPLAPESSLLLQPMLGFAA
jgi:diguanylate cyclase (GGDEF)-like protein